MRTLRCLRSHAIAALGIIIGFTACRSPDRNAHIHSLLAPAPPTGFYTLVTDLGYHLLTVWLLDTGDFQVTSELFALNKFSHTQTGRWAWNQQRQEFLLTPDHASEDLGFEFRRLQVGEQDPDTLIWLPLNGPASVPDGHVVFRRSVNERDAKRQTDFTR